MDAIEVCLHVSVTERDIAARAFATPEWRSSADALFQAAGINVTVVDLGSRTPVSAAARCGHCHVLASPDEAGPNICFDACPSPDAPAGRMLCRAGLVTLFAPLDRGGVTIAHVMMSGFVTSTRERRAIYETIVARGASEDTARRAVKALPVIARRQADAYLQMALSSARTLFEATAERILAAERVEELRTFVSAGQSAAAADTLDAAALAGIVEEAVAMAGGQAGAILRVRGAMLEVIAHTSAWRGHVGTRVARSSTAAGRAVDTMRTVVAPGNDDRSTLAMPLTISGRTLGVLEVRLGASALPVSKERLARLSRFGQFIAIAVERQDERAAAQRAMAGYAQLNELAAVLGGQTDMGSVAEILVSVMEKAFCSELAGLVLTGWGHDRADVVVCGDVPSQDIDTVLGDAAGRDLSAHPIEHVRLVTHLGSVVPEGERGEWSLVVAGLRHGDLDIGTLFLARSDGVHFTAQDHALLDGIAAHGGAAFGRAALFSRIRDDYAKTIAALSATLDFGERAVAGHAGRVMEYAMALGMELKVGSEQVEHLRFAGLLHDIGKNGVPEEILLKPTRLTDAEFERAKSHVEIGASIIDQIDFLKALTPIILHHHEWWDGTGYPHKLAREEIPLLARVLSVADSFDAMTTKRAYADKLTVAQARAELEAGSGTQFDPRVVDAFLRVLDRMAIAGGTGLLVAPDLRERRNLFA